MENQKKGYFDWICEKRKQLRSVESLPFSYANQRLELAHVYVDPWSGSYMLGVFEIGKDVPFALPARQVYMSDTTKFDCDETEKSS